MRKLFLVVLVVTLYVINSHANDHGQNSYQFQSSNGGGGAGGSSFTSSQSGSQSVIQSSNGDSHVIITRRTGKDGQETDPYISVTNPNVRIDGDYCKKKNS